MSRPIRTSHSMELEREDDEGNPLPPIRVYYELETWTEVHEHGYTEYFSDLHPLWAEISGTEVQLTQDTLDRLHQRLG